METVKVIVKVDKKDLERLLEIGRMKWRTVIGTELEKEYDRLMLELGWLTRKAYEYQLGKGDHKIRNLVPRQKVEEIEYTLDYWYKGAYRRNGFAFPSDKDGNVKISDMAPEAKDSLAFCMGNPEKFEPPEVNAYRHHYIIPAYGSCAACHNIISLEDFTNTCDKCGAEYNMLGQRLAPREQWEEDYERTE